MPSCVALLVVKINTFSCFGRILAYNARLCNCLKCVPQGKLFFDLLQEYIVGQKALSEITKDKIPNRMISKSSSSCFPSCLSILTGATHDGIACYVTMLR